MKSMSIKDARANFSALLDQVEAGDELVLIRRGKAVARIVPPHVRGRRLPKLGALRASLTVTGQPLSREVRRGRDRERY